MKHCSQKTKENVLPKLIGLALCLCLYPFSQQGTCSPSLQAPPINETNGKSIPGSIVDYKLLSKDNQSDFLIQADRDLKDYTSFYLDSPPRFVLDIPKIKAPKRYERITVNRPELICIRIVQREDKNKVRIVFDLTGDGEVECRVKNKTLGLEVSIRNRKKKQIVSSPPVMENRPAVRISKIGTDFKSQRHDSIKRKISIDLVKADIREFFMLVSRVSGISIQLSPEINEKITLKLKDIPWDKAVKAVADLYRLKIEEKGNSLYVSYSESL